MANEIYLTEEGLKNLKDELKDLKRRKPELSNEIGRARELGDLKENAEYHAAKESLSHLMRRITEVEDKVARARVIDESKMDKNVVYIGATVTFKDLDENDDNTYTIVDVEEANASLGKISVQSPLAQGLLGKKKGEEIKIALPAGVMHVKILDIKR